MPIGHFQRGEQSRRIFLTQRNFQKDILSISKVVERLLGVRVFGIERISGGGNNRVFKVKTVNEESFFVKQYFKLSSASNRLEAEFYGLKFLWKQGIRHIARPLAVDSQQGIAVFDFIKGERANLIPSKSDDITQAINFLTSLKSLVGLRGAQKLQSAAEACFSLNELTENLNKRLLRLNNVETDVPLFEDFRKFRDKEMVPTLERLKVSANRRCANLGSVPFSYLDHAHRTLSPSDFGFHNAIRRHDDVLTFVDFEYFGWDDPAKTISDFLLHPAMELDEQQSSMFLRNCINKLGETDDNLCNRVKTYFPLYGLKWTIIVLNEFCEPDWKRRKFSGRSSNKTEYYFQGQLEKANMFLRNAIQANEEFPYVI